MFQGILLVLEEIFCTNYKHDISGCKYKLFCYPWYILEEIWKNNRAGRNEQLFLGTAPTAALDVWINGDFIQT